MEFVQNQKWLKSVTLLPPNLPDLVLLGNGFVHADCLVDSFYLLLRALGRRLFLAFGSFLLLMITLIHLLHACILRCKPTLHR